MRVLARALRAEGSLVLKGDPVLVPLLRGTPGALMSAPLSGQLSLSETSVALSAVISAVLAVMMTLAALSGRGFSFSMMAAALAGVMSLAVRLIC